MIRIVSIRNRAYFSRSAHTEKSSVLRHRDGLRNSSQKHKYDWRVSKIQSSPESNRYSRSNQSGRRQLATVTKKVDFATM